MIRAVLAVVLTVALLAAATPAIDEGRRARTATHLNGVTDRIERATRSLLAHEDPTPPAMTGPRRIVRFRLPAPSWTAAGATLRIDGARDRIGYRIDGRPPSRTSIRGIDLRTPTGPVVYAAPGRHRLVVSLVRDDGVGVVVERG
ncbi:MAG: ABC transporter [Haloplanus sp.]